MPKISSLTFLNENFISTSVLTQAGGLTTKPRVRADLHPCLLTHINMTLSSFPLPAQRMMGYAAPGGVVSVVLTTSFLIKNIHHRHGERGCSRDHPKDVRLKLVHNI